MKEAFAIEELLILNWFGQQAAKMFKEKGVKEVKI